MDIVGELFKYQDFKYGDFTAKLSPNLCRDNIIGVRTPILRQIAKKMYMANDYKEFLVSLPHKYFEENQLHAFIISLIKDYDTSIELVNNFLPYIDNWATCDQLRPKAFDKNKDKLIIDIGKWIKSNSVYTIRFGVEMLMTYYLDDDFKPEYFKMVCDVVNDDYYVKMMIAWYFATALAKQYETTLPILENKNLDMWTHNKTIQKAIESYRISEDNKTYLRTLKVKE